MIEHDGHWYPFMNEVAKHNLGLGNDFGQCYALIKDYTVAIDGGAQVGRVANRLASMFEKVYAIELAEENFDCLVKNALPNVTPIHACLFEAGGWGFGYEPDKHPDSPVYRAAYNDNAAMSLAIDELALPTCGFIKLDLQGFDYFALKGAVETIKRCKPVIYFEYDPSCFERYGIHKDASQIFLESLGYIFHGSDDGNQLWSSST